MQTIRQLMIALIVLGFVVAGNPATLTGQVTDSDGQPLIDQATLDLFAVPEKTLVRTIQTDAQGHFSFPHLPPGSYQLRVRAEGWSTEWHALRLSADRNLGSLPIRLLRAGVLSGRVLTDTGQPLGDTEVRMYTGDLHAGWQTVRTDAEGWYHLPGVRPGRFPVVAFAEGYAETRVSNVTLGEGESRDHVDIVLRPAGSLTFRLLAADGKTPLAGRRLSYRLRPQNHQPDRQEKVWPQAQTDAEGRCSIPRIQPGGYELEVRLNGLRLTRAAQVRAGGTTELNLVLAGGKIQGRVRSDKGRPIPGAQVFLVSQAWFERHGQYALTPPSDLVTRTDETGQYLLESVPDGRPTVAVLAVGYARAAREVILRNGEVVEGVDFTLAETGAGELAMRVYLPQGPHPLAETPVTVGVVRQAPGGEYGLQRQAKTDSRGQIAWGRLDAGIYDVSVQTEGYVAGTRRVELKPGDHLDLAVRLRQGGEIEGKVVQGPEATPVAGARVEFLPQESLDLWRTQPPLPDPFPLRRGGATQTGPDGRYHIAALEPGLYAARVLLNGVPVGWIENISVWERETLHNRNLHIPESKPEGPVREEGADRFADRPIDDLRKPRPGADRDIAARTAEAASVEAEEAIESGASPVPPPGPPKESKAPGPAGPARHWDASAALRAGLPGRKSGDRESEAGTGGGGVGGGVLGDRAAGRRRRMGEGGEREKEGGLAPAGSIAGRVVAREDTHPLRQRQVKIGLEREEQGGRTLSNRIVQTDAEGYYVLDKVLPGFYNLYFYAPGYAQAQIRGVTVQAGQRTSLGRVRLELGGRLRGQVANLQNEPLAGAEVLWEQEYQPVTVKGKMQVGPGGRPGAVTDAQGNYAIDELAAGTYRVGARHRHYLPHLAEEVEIRQEQETELNFRLSRGGILAGTVYRADGQTPCPTGMVQAIPTVPDWDLQQFFARAERTGEALTTATDEAGCYRLVGLRPGVYRIVAWDVSGRTARRRGVIVQDGQALTGIDLKLGGEIPAGTASNVRVRVVGPNGTPISHAEVLVQQLRGGEGVPQPTPRKTNEQGEAIFPQVAPGEAQILANRADFAPVQQQAQVFPERENVFTVQLLSGGEITGQVITEAPFTPDRLEVVAVPEEEGFLGWENAVRTFWGRQATSNLELSRLRRVPVRSDHTYHLVRVAPGTHALFVFDRPTGDVLTMRAGVVVKEKKVTPGMALQVTGPGALLGRVVRADNGAAVPRAAIVARLLAGRENPRPTLVRRTTWTDAQGWFEIPLLPLGRWQVEASAPGLARMTTVVNLGSLTSARGSSAEGAGKWKPVSLTLPTGGSVRGQVTLRETGETVPGLRVFALGEDHLQAVTTVDGQFRLDHLPPGGHTLVAAADGLRTVTEARVEVQEGQEVLGVEIEVARED